MRPTLISLLSVAVAVAACNDEQQPTSPVAGTLASVSTPTAVTQTARTPEATAKPTDQVGFTKIQYFESTLIAVAAGATGAHVFNCPAGTFVVSGGHNIWGGNGPLVRISRAAGNGWEIQINNTQNGALPLSFSVGVNCAS
jgi:hypothetical protein